MASQDVTHFTAVDHTADPGFFLHFLDEVNKLSATVVWKSAVLNGLGIQPGAQVLDVGCGLGTDAFDLAVRVGPGGHVTGVDFSESLIGEAIRRSAGLDLPVTFEVGDAQALRFPDYSPKWLASSGRADACPSTTSTGKRNSATLSTRKPLAKLRSPSATGSRTAGSAAAYLVCFVRSE
jgi:SAM-dependent methyltransferase